MPAIDIESWVSRQLELLARSHQRQLVILQGESDRCDEQLGHLASLEPSTLLLSNRDLPGALAFSKADTCLGNEARLVVLDLFDGFNPDVLCIASGLVCAGGLLLLMAPEAEDWDLMQDRYAIWQDQARSRRALFAEYFFGAVEADDQIGIMLGTDLDSPEPVNLPQLHPTPISGGQTAEQLGLLQQIETWLSSSRRGIALILADRGRGKSSCLGLLMHRLSDKMQILVSADSRQAVTALLRLAPQAEFIAPDRLLQTRPPADLLIVDEAAMIPLPMLRQMIRLYPHSVMATTTGGYEGTGHGFMLRFVELLKHHGLRQFELQHPVRWCQGDLLEAWLDRTLMLKPDRKYEPGDAADGDLRLRLMSHTEIAREAGLIRQVYRLLTSAHYRTRPSDLRMLMENPDLVIVIAQQGPAVIGALLLNPEGGFEQELCQQVFLGQRRPRGHLLAQMLTAQAGVRDFAGRRGARVQRIAVAENYRRRGIGRRLIETAIDYCRQQSLVYLGASFALNAEILRFWQGLKFELVHISYAQGKSSGNHSVAVLKPVGDEIEPSLIQMRQRIQAQLAVWLTQYLQFMPADEIVELLHFCGYPVEIAEFEWRDIEAFCEGNKGFELCFASLQKFVMRQIAESDQPPDDLLVEKCLQNRGWDRLDRESGAMGRKQLQQRLRGLVAALYKAC